MHTAQIAQLTECASYQLGVSWIGWHWLLWAVCSNCNGNSTIISKHISEAEGQSLIIGTNSLPLMMLGPAQSQKRRRASLQTQSGSSGSNRCIMTWKCFGNDIGDLQTFIVLLFFKMFRYYKHPHIYQKVIVDSFVLVGVFSVNNSQQQHLAPVMLEVLKISTR